VFICVKFFVLKEAHPGITFTFELEIDGPVYFAAPPG
jgi:hypothetical protein